METLILELKNISVSLPSYMSSLSSNLLEEVTENSFEDVRIIACGVDPKDSILYYITNDIEVMCIKPNGKMIPSFAVPTSDGREILVRFGENSVHAISAGLLLKESSMALEKSKVFLNDSYLCDLENLETVAL
jgi:hypothetical protein